MKKLILALLFFAAILPCFAKTFVAVVETVAENGAIGRSERMFLTDKLRESAKKVLPESLDYTIMTRENIRQMLPPGKKVEDCEGECLVETGKNINAHYIAQARVGKFGKSLTLTVELYETMGNNLVGSFTARKADAEGLLNEIERQAESMFAIILAGKMNDDNHDFSDGFINMNLGYSYKVEGAKKYIVRVASNPKDVVFTVDGRPDGDCNKTPCSLTLDEGKHHFSFGLKNYFDYDTLLNVNSAGQELQVNLKANFGTLILEPLLQKNLGNPNDLEYLIDGSQETEKQLQLSLGTHHVVINHPCYETKRFKASFKSGSELIYSKPLNPKTGSLNLKALENGKPKTVPVFIDGKMVGKTPFQKIVNVCSDVTVGEVRRKLPIAIKQNANTAYTYDFGYTNVSEDGESNYEYVDSCTSNSSNKKQSDVRSFVSSEDSIVDHRDGQVYRTVIIGNRTWMAQNLNYKTEESWCYDDYSGNCQEFGRLYDWTSAQNVCPEGWRLPSNLEFQALMNTAGGENKAGKKLKSIKGWPQGGNGKDSFGFNALPAGFKAGIYHHRGDASGYWSSTEDDGEYAYYMFLLSNDEGVRLRGKEYGYSIRCVKNTD